MPLLRERLNAWNLAAIGLLMGGQVAVLGGIGHLSLGRGDVLVLVATWLWAIEVIICKRLLFEIAPATVSLIRMGVGSAVLLAYLAVTGTMSVLINLSASQLGWALLTGLLLAGYVGTWMTALSRARAVDVTSVLVASTVVTSLLFGNRRNGPGRPRSLRSRSDRARGGRPVLAWHPPGSGMNRDVGINASLEGWPIPRSER